jgi:peptidyl-tRNA hydrolase
MTELSQASLEAMLMRISEYMDESGEKISAVPTYFMVRPADLEELGITVEDVARMIKEKQT